MKLKYYLRGLAVGIMATTIILAISNSFSEKEISDAEIMTRAAQLGMIMPDDTEKEDTAEDDNTTDADNPADTDDENTTDEPDSSENESLNTETVLDAADTEMQTPEDTENIEPTETIDNTETVPEDSETVPPETENTEAQTMEPTDAADAGTEPEQTQTPVDSAPNPQEPYVLVVNKGEVCRTVCERLAQAGIIDDAEALRKYLMQEGVASFISVGTYHIPYGSNFEQIAAILRAGSLERQQ